VEQRGVRARRVTDEGSAAGPARSRAAVLGAVSLGALAAALLALAAFTVGWRATGGRWFVVRSPSMGTAAPVGTLVWVRPVSFDDLRVGQLVSFRAPPAPQETYTHRVVARRADGSLTTKGDNNDMADPWSVRERDVIGRVAMHWWPVGWLVRAAPILGFGGVLLWALGRWCTAPAWKLPVWIVGLSLLVSLSIYVVKPLVRAELLSFTPAPRGAQATFVTTGILPLRVSADGGGHVDVAPGEKRSLVATRPDHRGLYRLKVGPHLSWRSYAGVALVVLAPSLWTVLFGLAPVDAEPGDHEEAYD
jgi:signal peptidase I